MVVVLPDLGRHDLKIPSVFVVTKLLNALDKLHIAALVSLSSKSVGSAELLTLAKEAGPEMAALLGAVIGKAWNHADQALESVDDGDLMVYGEAVFEELHEAGYSFDSLVMLGLTVVRAIWEQSQLSQEAKDRANFIFPTRARAN
jgi:hypothetical protein